MTEDKKAAAIKYVKGDFAPFLICKGRNHMAERLLEEAEKAGIPILKNPEVLKGLIELEPLAYIPEELFEAVAEILAFVYALDSGKNYEYH